MFENFCPSLVRNNEYEYNTISEGAGYGAGVPQVGQVATCTAQSPVYHRDVNVYGI